MPKPLMMWFDYAPDGDPIEPCFDCFGWYVEVLTDPTTGALFVREWHAAGCIIWCSAPLGGR